MPSPNTPFDGVDAVNVLITVLLGILTCSGLWLARRRPTARTGLLALCFCAVAILYVCYFGAAAGPAAALTPAPAVAGDAKLETILRTESKIRALEERLAGLSSSNKPEWDIVEHDILQLRNRLLVEYGTWGHK